ncbi:MAG TPA: efflux RND transporter periplasmic adaptor subunit [Catalimonadaceae bacterium]|jgi:HlyD family secretion protein|nr:efflux RND transporter periplasmic adaptor subunit [Catalimonadaceae bacterium]
MLKNALFGLILPLLLAGCGEPEDKTKPVRKDITQAVYASGKIFPVDYYRLNVSIPGYIKEIFVRVGDTVKVGQPLFAMKSEVSNLNVATARNNLDLATLNANENSAYLSNIKQDVALAKEKMELDSSNFFRVQNLFESNAATKVMLDQARSQYIGSQKNFEKAKNALRSTRERLQTEVKNAQNLFRAQQSNSNDFTYYAAVTGRVYDIAGKQGEYYTPQQIIMELGRIDDYEVELYVDESDIHYLAKNQEVIFQTEAYPNLFLKGSIKEVYPKISSSSKSIKVLADINLPDGIAMYAGATLEANIINQQKANALVVPRYYLSADSVIVKRDGKKQKIKLELGIGNVEFVEVLNGLNPDEEVYKQ